MWSLQLGCTILGFWVFSDLYGYVCLWSELSGQHHDWVFSGHCQKDDRNSLGNYIYVGTLSLAFYATRFVCGGYCVCNRLAHISSKCHQMTSYILRSSSLLTLMIRLHPTTSNSSALLSFHAVHDCKNHVKQFVCTLSVWEKRNKCCDFLTCFLLERLFENGPVVTSLFDDAPQIVPPCVIYYCMINVHERHFFVVVEIH
jgi:hypothetical protein